MHIYKSDCWTWCLQCFFPSNGKPVPGPRATAPWILKPGILRQMSSKSAALKRRATGYSQGHPVVQLKRLQSSWESSAVWIIHLGLEEYLHIQSASGVTIWNDLQQSSLERNLAFLLVTPCSNVTVMLPHMTANMQVKNCWLCSNLSSLPWKVGANSISSSEPTPITETVW